MEKSPGSYLQEEVSSEEVFALHQGDSRSLIDYLEGYVKREALESGFLDVTITSPPYADLKNYDSSQKGDGPTQNPNTDQIGFNQEYEEYLDTLRSVFKQVYDLTKEEGSLWIVVNTFKQDGRVVRLPNDIIDVCENLPSMQQCPSCQNILQKHPKSGAFSCSKCEGVYDPLEQSWTLHDMVIWDKERALPYTGERTFRNVFEYLLVFKKTDNPRFDFESVRIADPAEFSHWWVDWPERYHPRGMVPENIWQMVTPSQGKWGTLSLSHPAPFPPDLIERIVALTTDESSIVLDPFAGTGMTLAQASSMGRSAIGFELMEEYVKNYPSLEDEINERWQRLTSEGETLEKKQERLSRVIWGLRQLVYARKMTLQLRRDLEEDSIEGLGLNTIYVLQQPDQNLQNRVESVACDVNFVVDGTSSQESVRKMRRLVGKYREEKPWSSFELDASTDVWNVKRFHTNKMKGELFSDRLYLYPGNRHYKFKRSVGTEEWFKEVQNPNIWRSNHATEEYPPMISNISIVVERGDQEPRLAVDPLDEPPEEDVNSQDTLGKKYKSTRLTDF